MTQTTDITIPQDADSVDWMVRGAGALAGIVAQSRDLIGQGHTVRWLIPLSQHLVYRLEGLVATALAEGVQPLPIPQEAVDAALPPLRADDHLFVWDFLQYSLLGERKGHYSVSQLTAYGQLRDLSLTLAGEVSPRAPEGTMQDVAQTLLAHQGPVEADADAGRSTLIEDLKDVLGIAISGHIRATFAPRRKLTGDPKMPHVLLIGAYGGDHIGDTAILGGVLGRIHARHGTKTGILMTQRVAHTGHLIPMLDVPVDMEVREYTHANIAAALKEVDGVVFAGGPLTDIPKQLVRHLETAARAKRMGLPFVMEGVGPNYFPRLASRVTARRLVKLADRINIRVKEDAERPLVAGLDMEIGHDPAFDYLKTREPALTRLVAQDVPQVDALLEGTEGRPKIGINIRPIGPLYAEPPAGQTKEEFTNEVVDRFERELARGITDYAAQSAVKPCFIFFPMNAIHFGSSDLKSAWRIMRHLGPEIDFRLWEADASLDGVVHLLRKLDGVIAMRFHAAIFALSQGKEVIGIDYVIGKRDKVAAVLTDAGYPDNVTRIDQLDADWLSRKLAALEIPGET